MVTEPSPGRVGSIEPSGRNARPVPGSRSAWSSLVSTGSAPACCARRDVWVRPNLAPRDRSLVAIDALIASNRLAGHLDRAVDNGPTREQASEAVAHLAFHAGWPNASSAVPVVRNVSDNRSNQPGARTARARVHADSMLTGEVRRWVGSPS